MKKGVLITIAFFLMVGCAGKTIVTKEGSACKALDERFQGKKCYKFEPYHPGTTAVFVAGAAASPAVAIVGAVAEASAMNLRYSKCDLTVDDVVNELQSYVMMKKTRAEHPTPKADCYGYASSSDHEIVVQIWTNYLEGNVMGVELIFGSVQTDNVHEYKIFREIEKKDNQIVVLRDNIPEEEVDAKVKKYDWWYTQQMERRLKPR